MNKGIIFVIVLVVVFVLIFFFSTKRADEGTPSPSPTPSPTSTPLPTDVPGQSGIQPKTFISLTATSFSPQELTINVGETVTFINHGVKARWPASDIHPTHQLYPGSGLIKCGTPEAGSIFDACRGLNPGESFSFTFNEKGTWFYHDHLEAFTSGKIIVE